MVGAATAPSFDGKLREERPFLDGIIALHAINAYLKYSIFVPARSGNLQEVWGAFRRAWIGVSGRPNGIHVGESGAWETKVWTNLCAGNRIKFRPQGVDARPWILRRRNGLTRGI